MGIFFSLVLRRIKLLEFFIFTTKLSKLHFYNDGLALSIDFFFSKWQNVTHRSYSSSSSSSISIYIHNGIQWILLSSSLMMGKINLFAAPHRHWNWKKLDEKEITHSLFVSVRTTSVNNILGNFFWRHFFCYLFSSGFVYTLSTLLCSFLVLVTHKIFTAATKKKKKKKKGNETLFFHKIKKMLKTKTPTLIWIVCLYLNCNLI